MGGQYNGQITAASAAWTKSGQGLGELLSKGTVRASSTVPFVPFQILQHAGFYFDEQMVAGIGTTGIPAEMPLPAMHIAEYHNITAAESSVLDVVLDAGTYLPVLADFQAAISPDKTASAGS